MTGRDIWHSDGSLDGVVPLTHEAWTAAARAATDAGMTVSAWLSQLIKYAGSMEELRRHDSNLGAFTKTANPPFALAPGAGLTADISVPFDAVQSSRAGTESADDEQAIEACLRAYAETGKFPPVTVRRVRLAGGNSAPLEVFAGEQRWRAARRAKLSNLPVRIQDCSEADALVLFLREARKHRNLPPMAEARCYLRLMRGFDIAAATVAQAVDQPLEHVVEMLSLLSLPRAVQKMVEDGVLTRLHAQALIAADDPEAIAWEIAGRGLDIYQTELLVRNAAKRNR